MDSLAGPRRFSAADLCMIPALAGSLLLLIFLFIWASQGEGYRNTVDAWAVVAMIFLGFAFAAAGAAYGLSFRNRTWLWGVGTFGALQAVQSCFHVFPLNIAGKGVDLLWLIVGVLLILGSEVGRRGVTAGAIAKAGEAPRTPESRLKQLKQLHDSGLLADAEYADARKQVLSDIHA